VTSSEFKRWLAAQGATFKPGKGSHQKVTLKGITTSFPDHGRKEMKTGTLNGICKQLGIKKP
jgi:mRNA interferase HicA